MEACIPATMTLSFAQLQAQLKPEWGREHDGNGADFDLLMLPSLSVDPAQIAGAQVKAFGEQIAVLVHLGIGRTGKDAGV